MGKVYSSIVETLWKNSIYYLVHSDMVQSTQNSSNQNVQVFMIKGNEVLFCFSTFFICDPNSLFSHCVGHYLGCYLLHKFSILGLQAYINILN